MGINDKQYCFIPSHLLYGWPFELSIYAFPNVLDYVFLKKKIKKSRLPPVPPDPQTLVIQRIYLVWPKCEIMTLIGRFRP